MNNKIPLRTLAESMAEKAGVSPAEAQGFIKAVFQQVIEALYAGDDVELDSFGKFTTVSNLSDPICFTPCDELVDEMNAPFALFSPIEIQDADSIDSIMSVEHDVVQPEVEETAAPEVEDTVASEDAPTSFETEPIVEVYAERRDAEVEHYEIEMTQSDFVEKAEEEPREEPKAEVALPDDLPELPETVINEDAEDVPELPEALTEVETTEAEKEVMPEPTVSEPMAVEEEQIAAPVSQVSEPIPAVAPTIDYTEPTVIPESEEQRTDYYVQRSSRFGLGFVLGLIVGLLIGAIALACYAIYFVNTGLSLF
ncbi:MAG: HU family DNA-binding protein [Paramuribaculum sp.]|nr:HU family DNA-binding protein [Paramuribaculum sp.]